MGIQRSGGEYLCNLHGTLVWFPALENRETKTSLQFLNLNYYPSWIIVSEGRDCFVGLGKCPLGSVVCVDGMENGDFFLPPPNKPVHLINSCWVLMEGNIDEYYCWIKFTPCESFNTEERSLIFRGWHEYSFRHCGNATYASVTNPTLESVSGLSWKALVFTIM